MHVSDFDYELPEHSVATRPIQKRGDSRLLVINKESGTIEHRKYSDLVNYLKPGDVVVLNDTKVIKARIIAKNIKSQERELLILEEHGTYEVKKRKVLYRGKLRVGEVLKVGQADITILDIYPGGIATVSSDKSLLKIAEEFGEVPLPPYMKRKADKFDNERYQTVFAEKKGSVAAPTASLNFTKELETKLRNKGIIICKLTLHVGLGTFLPIRTEDLQDHVMHSEYFEIPEETIDILQKAIQNSSKIVAIGTTVMRTLEYCADKIIISKGSKELRGEADIFIYPGYEFRIANTMLTNFHAPKSTVLMMAAAFAGKNNLSRAYQEAINEDYKFLSYGDSMLIIQSEIE